MEALKGKTNLMIAAQTPGPDAYSAVLLLLRVSKADLDCCDYKGRTALMLAARCGSGLVVQALIEAGAELELLCDRSESAWAKASRGGHGPSALLLEEAGARCEHALGSTEEASSSAIPTAFGMPQVRGCDAARFGSQFRCRMPVCMPGLVAGWPACRAWSEDRARLTMRLGGAARRVPVLRGSGGGDRTVAAEQRAPADGASLSLSSCLTCALDDAGPGKPMMSKLPLTPEALRDLGGVPHSLFGAPSAAVAGETRLWISSSGSITPLHYDHCHSVICQVVGRKRVTCFAPRDAAGLYPFSLRDGNVRTSRVDLWAWRFGGVEARASARASHPDVASTMPLETVLSAGDACYIPPGWWHHVETLDGGSISVLLPFDQSADEQRAMDRPWTRPGWGEAADAPGGAHRTLPPVPAAGRRLPPLARQISVDPMRLEGFPERVHEDAGGVAALRACEADGARRGTLFAHEPDWCDLACAQILHRRFGVIRLPRFYAEVYQQLLRPSLYPPCVADRERMRAAMPLEALPAALPALLRTWGYVCESICRQVTRRLLALCSGRAPLDASTGSRQHVESLRGLLRVSYSAGAHAHHAHYDGSYTTFLGPGNTAGCLQIADAAAAGSEPEAFLPSEHFLQRAGCCALDGGGFFVFTGLKHGGFRDPCKPLRHRVVAPSEPTERGEGAGEESVPAGAQPAQRINVIYFLNSYGTEPAPEPGAGDARCPLAHSDARLEVNSFGQTSVVSHAAFLCWPPPSPEQAGTEAAEADRAEPSVAEASWDEELAIDWSGDGL